MMKFRKITMANLKAKKAAGIVKYVASGLWWVVMLLGAVLIISFLSAHVKGEVPHIGKYSVMNIVSKSMEPEIAEGSYILIKRIAPEDVKKGDVICFYSTDPMIYGCPNTHRVVEEPYTEDGELYFVTKGDNNPIADKQPAHGDRLIGVCVRNMTGFTAFLQFISQNFLLLIGALLLLNVAIIFGSLMIKSKKESAAAQDHMQE